ncbi:E3 ubiquitin-protein ligase listerin isoform X2 [Palaemon carinicauda]|uniref:E3 ubiquitin-protein ligase listerin isoform X2 n=1 Tax=Palaemon carinicauda TaxID=392227 RepID=UPI0035B5DB84
MGKDKCGQRTKGNKKPSSSGRTAELLGGATGFVGFSALQDLGYVPAASQGILTDDSTISTEFRVTLRKMTKKDATTKIKALQEFEALCGSEDLESVKSALPFWPRIYSKLSVDTERRVREAAQVANKAIVIQVGKHLAPHLRAVMPTWLLAMVDPHTPAALTSSKAFQEAFSVEKRAEVLLFTCKAIMDHVSDNLFNQTPQTLSDPKVTAEEDMKSKYIRVLSCSLNGLSLFLSTTVKITSKKIEVIAEVKPVLQNPKFWKLAKHENPLVRSAWFSLVKNLFEFDHELVQDSRGDLSKAILAAIDDHDGSVLSHAWVAFLHLCVAYPDIWTEAATSRSVIGRIYSVLRDGGRGCATELYPQLLPVISLIPEKATDDKNTFYVEFFRAFSKGLCKPRVTASARDLSAGIKALFECLLFISNNNTDVNLWETLIRYQMVGLLQLSFTDMPQLGSSNLYREIAEILRTWAWKAHSDVCVKSLNNLTELFWNMFIPECQSILYQCSEPQIGKIKDFFTVLRTPLSKFSSKREGVKFADENKSTVLSEDIKNQKTDQEKVFLELTSQCLSPLIYSCYNFYQTENSHTIYKVFAILLSSFPSPAVYAALLGGADTVKYIEIEVVLQTIVIPKMEVYNAELIQSTMDIFMSLYSLMEPDKQRQILKNCKLNMSVGALRLLVENMTERKETDAVAAAWLLSSELGSSLVKLADVLCCPKHAKEESQRTAQHDELVALFNFVLRNGNKKEPIISTDYVSQILTKLTTNLKASVPDHEEPEEQMLQLVANLAGQLFSSYICWETKGIHEFMRSLFLLLCQSSKSLSEETAEILETTFLKAFKGLIMFISKDDSEKLLEEGGCLSVILKDMKHIVMEDSCTFSLTLRVCGLLQHLFKLVYEQLATEEECAIMLDHSKIQVMLNLLIPSEGEWTEIENSLSPLYVAPAILQGTIWFREFPFPRNMQENIVWNLKHTRLSLFLCNLLLYLCRPDDSDNLEATEEVSLAQYTQLAVLALHSTCHSTVMMELIEVVRKPSISDDVRMGIGKLQDYVKKLLQFINQGNKRLITKQIRDRCSDGSSSWCVTLNKVLSYWMKAEDINVSRLMNGVEDSALGHTATKQSLIPLMGKESLRDLIDEELTKMVSLSDDPFSATPSISLLTTALAHVSLETANQDIGSIFSVLMQWRETADSVFLFATDTSGMAWEDIALTCSIIRLVSVLVKNHSVHFQPQHWDFILCSLASWSQSLEESQKSIGKETVSGTFACAVCKCIGCVSEFMVKFPKLADKEKYPAKLADDWKEFFSPSVYTPIIPIFVEVSGSFRELPTVILYGVCRAICIGVCFAGEEELLNHSLPPIFKVEDAEADLKLPDSQQILLNHLTPLLTSPHPPSQFSAYNMITTVLPNIMEEWEKNEIDVIDTDDMPQRPLPYPVTRVIDECMNIVGAALRDKNFGDECVILPNTDIFVYSTAYLLAWRLALKAITFSSDANQHQYSAFLRQSDKLSNLLSILFKLMPQNPTIEEEEKDSVVDDKSPTMFTSELYIKPNVKVTSNLVAHLACKVYFDCVSQIPSAVRQWFICLDRQTQSLVDSFTSTFVSPLLISQEMSAVSSSTARFDNMQVKIRPGTREVIATYSIDEASMELILRMAPNHPLSTIVVEDHKRVGVSVAQWRNWLLGLNTMLSHRNTPLMQSLAFWKKNVDQKFEGIEECFICYYVLHGTNHQLPRLLCRTCKKKFHAACLYKWFNSSNKSTCPLCRSLF